ncbi:cystathionine gamma-synthase [Silvanigrella paludirubra]|uniref:L-methionine gamma-lyase n=1 Tax=Silvanigrella paludirubra TaxID=2499159 RepID=A0A6N6W067_9BACT|nr:cystathionine gamma-synthase [Silvanigrella paludirubra]KAB8041042.1 cystathionine gamma-synthase [Silvanigrella paludirubra]
MHISNTTKKVRSGIEFDKQFGSVIPPIYLSANYTFEDLGERREYDYSRSGNPTRSVLANTLSDIEGGSGSVVTSSGLSAVNLLLQLLKPGDLVIAPHDCYGGTWRILNALSQKEHLKVLFLDLNNTEELEAALKLKPKQVWIETPSNPLLRIVDIEKICSLAHKVDAQVITDNTFLSPLLQNPISLGSDYVLHSTTKYINGHSDIIGGCVVANSKEKSDELMWWANATGVTGSVFDSWLTLRGLRTLEVRVTKQQDNAIRIAEYLSSQKEVTKIYYPGLTTHENHHVAKKQQKGFGAMLSFELNLDFENMKTFISKLNHFSLAESLGGVESLIAHPYSMTHASMSAEAKKIAGISEGLIRLSVGIENAEDLIYDIDNALK